MKKIILSIVAVATLLTTAHAECVVPDLDGYKTPAEKAFHFLNENNSAYGTPESRKAYTLVFGETEGGEDALIQRFGTLTTTVLKQVGVGATVNTSYKQIARNYISYVSGLDKYEMYATLSFFGTKITSSSQSQNEQEGYEMMKSAEGFEKEAIQQFTSTLFAMNKETFTYLDSTSFIANFVLGKFHNPEILEDPQLKEFVKAIIQGNNVKAKEVVMNAKLYYPAQLSKKIGRQYSNTNLSEITYYYYCKFDEKGTNLFTSKGF